MKSKDVLMHKHGDLALLTLIIVIAISLSYASFYGPSQYSSDAPSYVDYATAIFSHNASSIAFDGVLGQKYVLNFGIALLYLLFGISALSSSLFGELCFIGTIILVFELGKKLSNSSGGLLSAFCFAIMPLAVTNAALVGDDIPMAFIAMLSVYAFYSAIKSSSRKRSVIYSVSAGFFMMIGFLITAEVIIVFVPIFFIWLYSCFKTRQNLVSRVLPFPSFIAGIALAIVLIMLWNGAFGVNPLLQFKSDSNWYNQTVWYVFNPGYIYPIYAATLFPVYTPSAGTGITSGFLGYFLPRFSNRLPQPYDTFSYVWFVYLALMAAIVSILIKKSNIILPSFLFASIMLYLIFGTMSISHYVFIPPFSRYTLLVAPAIALMVGVGYSNIFDRLKTKKKRNPNKRKNKHPNYSKKAIIIKVVFMALLILVALQSLYATYFIGASEHASFYPFKEAVSFLAHKTNVNLIETNNIIQLGVYLYPKKITYFNTEYPSCSMIPNNTYVISVTNSTFQKDCGLNIAAGPFTIPKSMQKFNLLMYDGIENSYADGSVTIYSR